MIATTTNGKHLDKRKLVSNKSELYSKKKMFKQIKEDEEDLLKVS
jgi:hypothetical protein